MECLIISGMSGAGKSMAVDVLEDVGYYCVDNMPMALIPKFIELFKTSRDKFDRVALVVDARSGEGFEELCQTLDEARGPDFSYRILFLDAQDAVLTNRHMENRRRHPLQIAGVDFEQALAQERRVLSPIRRRTDLIIDTSALLAKDFRAYLVSLFAGSGDQERNMAITVSSFGFKHGIPAESDMVIDVRFLRNPYYVPELKEKTGLDQEVFDYVFEDPAAADFCERVCSLLEFVIPRYIQEGKLSLAVSVGCTGGQHRSVSVARQLGQLLGKRAHNVNVHHRDVAKFKR
ncbi:MAG: RNase adapter RapZ [Clostridiaceae bacterium]|jgi:UPF0042 nucleotide-binding protein|nr:RNase adapter RapZ [Clostridiaceae bacterium]